MGEDLATDQADHQDPEQHADQADVQAHVAVEDVAELVGDDALQLVAIEPVQRATGYRDHRIRGGVAGGERIDAGLMFQHVELGHRHAGGDGDFLHHVAQATQGRIVGVLGHQRAAHLLGHRLAATAQAGDAVQRTQRDHAQRGHAGEQHHAGGLGDQPHHHVHRQHDAEHRQREQQHQPRRRPPRGRLAFEEIHAWASLRTGSAGPDQNWTFGASRTCACLSCGISSRVAAAKLNMPAKMLFGNTSRLLL